MDNMKWIDDKIDENEHFLGKELDEKKMERLNKLRELSVRFAKGERGVTYEAFPFSNRSRNAMVLLDIPATVFIVSPQSVHTLAEIFSLSDDVSFAVSEDKKKIRISFGIHDMWTK